MLTINYVGNMQVRSWNENSEISHINLIQSGVCNPVRAAMSSWAPPVVYDVKIIGGKKVILWEEPARNSRKKDVFIPPINRSEIARS